MAKVINELLGSAERNDRGAVGRRSAAAVIGGGH